MLQQLFVPGAPNLPVPSGGGELALQFIDRNVSGDAFLDQRRCQADRDAGGLG